MKQQIAIYLRLSLEDVDKRTNKVKDESNSIASQRMLINRHLDQNPLLCDLPRICLVIIMPAHFTHFT